MCVRVMYQQLFDMNKTVTIVSVTDVLHALRCTVIKGVQLASLELNEFHNESG